MLIRQRISNHPTLSDIKRYVVISGFTVDSDLQYLNILYKVEYFKDDADISSLFTKVVPAWLVTNNYEVQVLDANGSPINNPNYNPEDPNSKPHLMMPAFDYFKLITFDAQTPIRLKDLMGLYIIRDDAVNNRFNF